VPYDIDKQDCEQSDGDDGSYVLRYTDKKGKKHSNCHTSKKKAQAQIGYIGELDETDDMVFGGGGDPEAEGETEEGGMDEALLRAWVRERLLNEAPLTPSEMDKYGPRRYAKFLEKIKAGEPFELEAAHEKKYGGGAITIPAKGNEALIAALEANDANAYKQAFRAGVSALAGDGSPVTLSAAGHLSKAGGFGGSGPRGVPASIQNELDFAEFIATNASDENPITVILGDFTIDGVTGAQQSGSARVDGETSKADVVLTQCQGAKSCSRISLKLDTAEYWLSGDRVLADDFGPIILRLLNKQAPETRIEQDASGKYVMMSGDSKISRIWFQIPEPLAQQAVFGGGKNIADIVAKGNFMKQPTWNEESRTLNWPAAKVYKSLSEIPAAQEPVGIFRTGEAGRGMSYKGTKYSGIRPVIAAKGFASGGKSAEVSMSEKLLRNFIREKLLKEQQIALSSTPGGEPIQESLLRVLIREALLFTSSGDPLYIPPDLMGQIKAAQEEADKTIEDAEIEAQQTEDDLHDYINSLLGAEFTEMVGDADRTPYYIEAQKTVEDLETQAGYSKEKFLDTIARFRGGGPSGAGRLGKKEYKNRVGSEEFKRAIELLFDLAPGEFPRTNNKAEYDEQSLNWLDDLLIAVGGSEMLEDPANKKIMNTLARSLAGSGLSDEDIEKVEDQISVTIAGGMPGNYLRPLASALADFTDTEIAEINSETFPPAGPETDGNLPTSAGWSGLLDIAAGSRGANIGRGEVAASFFFSDVNPPDFHSGEVDLTTTTGRNIHVKDLTGGKGDPGNMYEGIPGKKNAVVENLEGLTGELATSWIQRFSGAGGKGLNISPLNSVDWAARFTAEKMAQAATDSKTMASIELAKTETIAACINFLAELGPALNIAGRKGALKMVSEEGAESGEEVLYFIDGGPEYKLRTHNETWFRSTDKDAVNMTIVENNSFESIVNREATAAGVEKKLNAGLGKPGRPGAWANTGKVSKFTGNKPEEWAQVIFSIKESHSIELIQLLQEFVKEKLLLEDLTRADRKEIERIFTKQMEKSKVTKKIVKKEIDAQNKMIQTMVDKAFKKNFDKELKDALGVSFFGTPGKINKFVVDEIHDEVEKILGDKATKEMVVQICKDVIIKLYRELSFSYPQVIQRMKV